MRVLLATAIAFAGLHAAVVVGRWDTEEARQGVAVDAAAFYAIDDTAIGKYDKTTGRRIAKWSAPADGRFIHLNGGVVVGNELLCAHSNYPAVPMHSTIEIFDRATLTHLRTHDLGGDRGSATWIDFHDDSWWVAFGHYSGRGGTPGKGSGHTTLRRFDAEWRERGAWRFPPEVVASWRGMTSSGGVWRGDRLYTTGHDASELYVLELPASGSVLRLHSTITVESAGQGVAIDRSADLLYSVHRPTKQVLVSRLP